MSAYEAANSVGKMCSSVTEVFLIFPEDDVCNNKKVALESQT